MQPDFNKLEEKVIDSPEIKELTMALDAILGKFVSYADCYRRVQLLVKLQEALHWGKEIVMFDCYQKEIAAQQAEKISENKKDESSENLDEELINEPLIVQE